MNKLLRKHDWIHLGSLVALGSAGAATRPMRREWRPPNRAQRGSCGRQTDRDQGYKTPQCGCCKAWADHLSSNGFQVETVDMPDLSIVKQKYGVTPCTRVVSHGCGWQVRRRGTRSQLTSS